MKGKQLWTFAAAIALLTACQVKSAPTSATPVTTEPTHTLVPDIKGLTLGMSPAALKSVQKNVECWEDESDSQYVTYQCRDLVFSYGSGKAQLHVTFKDDKAVLVRVYNLFGMTAEPIIYVLEKKLGPQLSAEEKNELRLASRDPAWRGKDWLFTMSRDGIDNLPSFNLATLQYVTESLERTEAKIASDI
ncbi:hypothetical protein DVT68_18235 [Dyella solisilvae]|uniref:Lipoprotein n=1 Tax=Dyella solisilvae TaxID=1920168 RepID=A0A370K315_9GAMM|nr:hypothetical protein [Dyella solisilvae]RDI97032.1 hypothetical protein DVT68_18235 [Dyella solisilvae]